MNKSHVKRNSGSDCVITSTEEFFDRKVEWFLQCWWNERHTDEEYINNMVHMGFEDDHIRASLYGEN